jgi:hypothetical protein
VTDMPVFLVRLKAGLGFPESLRVVHIVPADQMAPAVMVPYCGIVLRRGSVDPPLDGPQGAPCEACFRVAPIPGIEEAPPALPKREPGEALRKALDAVETIAVQAITARGSSPARAQLAAHNLELLH